MAVIQGHRELACRSKAVPQQDPPRSAWEGGLLSVGLRWKGGQQVTPDRFLLLFSPGIVQRKLNI